MKGYCEYIAWHTYPFIVQNVYDIISDVCRCPQKFVRTSAVYFNAQSQVRNIRKSPQQKKKKKKKNKSEFYTSFCGRPQAYLRRAADARKQTTPADMEKCPQKSAGFDKGTDICGFLVDIHQLPQKFRQMYADVHICP